MSPESDIAVLIVNDRKEVLTALADVLRPLGVSVATALSAREGLRLARKREFAVAMVDIRMPEMDGFAMVAELRADPAMRALPVIFASALEPTIDVRERVFALGAADLVSLPASAVELRAKVAIFVELFRQRQAVAHAAEAIVRDASAAVRDQQERFRLFMDAASDYAIFFTNPDGIVTEWPASAENVFGFAAGEAVGRHCAFIFTAEDRENRVPEREMMEATASGMAKDERWHERKSGERFYAVGRLITLRDDRGLRGYVKVLRDATGAKEAEGKLRDALQQFESLAESMTQMAWMADASGARFWFNRRWLDYTGTTIEQMRDWGYASVYHPAEREHVLARIKEGFAAEREWEDEWSIRGKDGTYRWFLTQVAPVRDHTGRVVRWFGTNTDIDKQVQLQKELKASEQKFREIFETANEGIWIIDADARIEIVNSRMAEMLGYEIGEIVGRPKTDFVFPEDVDYIRELFEQRRRGLTGAAEVRFRRRNQQEIWTLLSARPLFRDGKFAGALDMFTDISARKQFESELQRQVAQRTSALHEKTRQLESFAYTIAHDLRSPLRAISGYAEFTLEDFRAQLPPEAIANLDRIKASAARLDLLIRDLLSYARVSHVDYVEQDVSLASSLEWVLEHLRSEILARRAVIEVAPDLPSVRGERSIVDQVLLNLVSNAIKFVAPGAVPHVTITTTQRDGIVRVNVRDNGIGVPKEHHERIFKVFERLEGAQGVPGTGVGLAIVARAAERLGGRAGVESTPGQGSTFWIELRSGASPS